MQIPDLEIPHQMWTFTSGVILVILQSIVSGARRNWWSLLTGCVLGGAGSWIAGQIWADSKYLLIICGVSAVMTENLLIGVTNASKEFAEKPLKVATHIARTFLPTFGKSAGDTSAPINTDDLK